MSQQRSAGLSLEELARRMGETPEQLLRWQSLRLIGAEDQERFGLEDVECVRLMQFCLRRGVSVETIARAEEQQKGFLRHYVDQLFPAGIAPTYSLAEAAAKAGLNLDLVRRLQEMRGSPGSNDVLDKEDVKILRGWKVALEAGLPEEAESRGEAVPHASRSPALSGTFADSGRCKSKMSVRRARCVGSSPRPPSFHKSGL